MPRYGYGGRWGDYCSCPCAGPAWAWPTSKEEFVDELQDYKARLESEVVALEKKIKAVKEKTE